MARYAVGGKNTVEGCRSIDVLEWHRLGYLRSLRWFSWTWSTEGERAFEWAVDAQPLITSTLKSSKLAQTTTTLDNP